MVDICSQPSTESVLLPERPEEPWTYENLESRKALPEEKEQGGVIHFAVVGFPVVEWIPSHWAVRGSAQDQPTRRRQDSSRIPGHTYPLSAKFSAWHMIAVVVVLGETAAGPLAGHVRT